MTSDNKIQVSREDMRILWKQIASRHAFSYNPEYLNEGSLDALIEFARIAAVALLEPMEPVEPVAYRWKWDKNLEWHYGEYLSQRDYYASEPLFTRPNAAEHG